MSIDRRSFLRGAAAAGLGTALSSRLARADVAFDVHRVLEPSPTATPVTHTVVVMMENRSVDHYFGGHTSVDGFDAVGAVTYPSAGAGSFSTSNWGELHDGPAGTEYSGCDYKDPGHGWTHGRTQLNGKSFASYAAGDPDSWANGWLLDGAGNDVFATSYYDLTDVPVLSSLIGDFTTFDRYFCSVLGSTYPNREYMHSAQSGGIHNNDFPPQRVMSGTARKDEWMTGFDWPTIWDALERSGVSWGYYFSNLPVIALWGKRFAPNARHISSFYADCAAGTLPQVTFVDPFFVAPEGLANDDHPHADIRLGQEFLAGIASAFGTSPHWSSGAMFITYDEWGGFADRVPPPDQTELPGRFSDPRAGFDPLTGAAATGPKGGFGQLGFRVPTVLASPFARGGRVDHGVYDHVSILEFIQDNYLTDAAHRLTALDPGGARTSASIAPAFDFSGGDPTPWSMSYTAPAEAHVPCELKGHEAPAADLWALADNGWIEDQGYEIVTDISLGRFA